MKNIASSEYQLPTAQGRIEKVLSSQRRKMFDAFMEFKKGSDHDTILNVGMMPAAYSSNDDYLMAWADPQQRSRILSYEIDRPAPQSASAQAGAGSRRKKGEGIHLPFTDNAFDWAFCDEVIEHLTDPQQQSALVSELARVARKGVFLTTANRQHPIEFNTGLPFVHWLPAGWRRRLLSLLGMHLASTGGSLNLIDSAALYRMAGQLPGQPRHDVGHKRVFGIKAHFFLMIEKPRGPHSART